MDTCVDTWSRGWLRGWSSRAGLVDRVEVGVGEDLPAPVVPHVGRQARRLGIVVVDAVDVRSDLQGPPHGERVARLDRDEGLAEGEIVDDGWLLQVALPI